MIDPEPGADNLRKGAILIEKHFGIDPWRLDMDGLSSKMAAALWLETYEAEKLQKITEAALIEVASLILSKTKTK